MTKITKYPNHISTDNNSSKNPKRILGKAGGAAAGLGTYNAISKIPSKTTSVVLMRKICEINTNLTSDEFQKTGKGILEAFSTSGLKEKGTEIIEAGQENYADIKNIVKKELTQSKFAKYNPEEIIENTAESYAKQITAGQNAIFAMKSNKVVLPKNNKMILASFHEMGHALNSNMSKFAKSLQGMRGVMALSTPLVLISLLKNKKEEGDKPKNIFDKGTDFIKKHCAALVFATAAPVILEEGLATLKGNQLAKSVLDENLLKQVKKSNAFGFASYVLLAAGCSLGAFCANKVRDFIVSKSE